MKYQLVFCLFGFIVAAQAMVEEGKEMMLGFSKKCKQTSGIAEEILEKVRKADPSVDLKDEKLNQFSLCMMKTMGLVDDDGGFHKDIAIGIAENHEKKGVEETLDNCYKTIGKIDETTAATFCKCYHDKYPEHLIF